MLTACDEEHAVSYCRILDAEAVRADWREVARIVLHIDPEAGVDRARRDSTATWAHERGFASNKQLLRRDTLR